MNKTKFYRLAAKKIRELAIDEWITVHPNGQEHKGTHIEIDESGTVTKGMGGTFNGYKIGEIKKDFTGPRATKSQIEANQKQASQTGLKSGHKQISNPQKIKREIFENGFDYVVIDNPRYIEGMKIKKQIGDANFKKYAPADVVNQVDLGMSELKLRKDKISIDDNGNIIGGDENNGNVRRLLSAQSDIDKMSGIQTKSKRSDTAAQKALSKAKEKASQDIQGKVNLTDPLKITKKTDKAVAIEKNGETVWIPKSAIETEGNYITHMASWAVESKGLSDNVDSGKLNAEKSRIQMEQFEKRRKEEFERDQRRREEADAYFRERDKRFAEKEKAERQKTSSGNSIYIPDELHVDEGDIVWYKGKTYKVGKALGGKRIDNETPSMHGSHLLGYEGGYAQKHDLIPLTEEEIQKNTIPVRTIR